MCSRCPGLRSRAEDAAASEPPEAAGQPAAGEGDAGVQLETEHSERNSKRSADDRKLHGHAEARRDRDRDTDRDRDRSSRREGDRWGCSAGHQGIRLAKTIAQHCILLLQAARSQDSCAQCP